MGLRLWCIGSFSSTWSDTEDHTLTDDECNVSGGLESSCALALRRPRNVGQARLMGLPFGAMH